MSETLLAHGPLIRLGAFAGILAVMALWEWLSPRRHQEIGRLRRWPSNLGIIALNSVVVRLVFPAAAVGTALLAEARGWGLLQALEAPTWLAIAASVILLDLAIYLQHVLFHAVPVLWRLHRMHHADLEFDVTTGVRFHPIEILLSMGIKLGVVAALGTPAVAVLVFEVLLNATSHVQPRQCPAAGASSTECCAGSWSRRRCIGSTIRSCRARPTAISASTCPGGIGCSAPIAPSRPPGTRA